LLKCVSIYPMSIGEYPIKATRLKAWIIYGTYGDRKTQRHYLLKHWSVLSLKLVAYLIQLDESLSRIRDCVRENIGAPQSVVPPHADKQMCCILR